MKTYRVVVLDVLGEVERDLTLTAASTEDAVAQAVPEPLVRGEKGVSRRLRAKVYFDGRGSVPTLVRFYARA